MLLGGTVAGHWEGPEQWEALLAASHFKAVTAPFNCHTARSDADAYCGIARKHGAVIAEVGVWKNLFDPDPRKAAENMAYAKAQLALADERGIACCVNIVGTSSPVSWDAADKSNFTSETWTRAVASIREIIDDVRPVRAFYCIEPMPWMIPDSPEVYLQLIRDVDRPQFAAHMDFVNMINCPRRFLDAEGFIDECFRTLAPYIKSTHIKDSRMDLKHLTTVLEECSPGEGGLDIGAILKIINKYLPADAPVLLEHMSTFDEYARAYRYVADCAAKAGVNV